MNSFKDPLVTQIIEPIGIDKAIQNLQGEISKLGWIEKCFARAYDSYKPIVGNEPRSKMVVYPEVWQGIGKDLLEVLPNDNLKSQVFFRVDDPVNVVDYAPINSQLSNIVHIIFWFNLNEIDDSMDYRYTELLKASAYDAIQNAHIEEDGEIRIVKVYEKATNVFTGYDISQIPSTLLVHPYGGFRFECELFYTQQCPPVDI